MIFLFNQDKVTLKNELRSHHTCSSGDDGVLPKIGWRVVATTPDAAADGGNVETEPGN